ncbi:hypothetical protein BD779DRAFT_449261 [Infundibulicybe gibba]|nr:hypothetical protein BD779DRAFT_449261 [Infundibulicybe gibba]
MYASIKLTDLNYYKNSSTLHFNHIFLTYAVMSRHRNITTATRQPRHDHHQETPLAPDVRAWVQSLVNQYGITEQYLTESCNKLYGANGVAVAKMEAEKAQQLINEGHVISSEFTPILVVPKPSPNERMIIVKLSDDDSIRIWEHVFTDPHVFFFDFINGQGEYIRTPPDVKIYSDGPGPFGEVLSMEQLSQRPGTATPRTWPGYDPNEETYLIAEGSKIRIVRPGHLDCHLTIPSRRPRDGRYVVMPEYW